MMNINAERRNTPAGARRSRQTKTARGRGGAARDELVAEISALLADMRTSAERERVRRLLRRSVSLTHLHVLAVLRAEGPLSMSELAAALDVSVASATGIVSRMEERGLVERGRSADDRRIVTVSLAAGGLAALDQLEGWGREHFTRLLERLTLAELEVVRGAFVALRRAREEQAMEGAKGGRRA